MMNVNPFNLRQEQGSNMLITKSIRYLLVGIVALFSFSTQAFAQSTVLVLDQSRVLRDSEVGKHIQRQLESIGKAMDSEFKASTTPIVSERDRLIAEVQSIGPDAVKSRPDLQARAKTLAEKGQKQQVEAKYKQAELQVTEQKAIAKVNEKLKVILETLVAERNADVILDRSLVMYGGTSVDITETVISRLNSQMRTVTVTRERLPRQQ